MGARTRFLAALIVMALAAWVWPGDPHWAERHLFGSYCATTAADTFIGTYGRWLASGSAFLLVLMSQAIGRGLGRTLPLLRGTSTLAIALAVAASLLVTELYMRRLHDRLELGEGRAAPRQGALSLARTDPRLGWIYRPGQVTWAEIAGRRVAYTIDADGDRATATTHRADPSAPTIVVTGESIAFGHGLAYEETLPALIEQRLHIQTVNLAVEGYGNDQVLIRLQDALGNFVRPVAVVTLFVPEEIRRNVEPCARIWPSGRTGSSASCPPRRDFVSHG